MLDSTEVGHSNDNISSLVPCLGLTQGAKPVKCLRNTIFTFKGDLIFFSPCLHSCDKGVWNGREKSSLSLTETSGGAKAVGKNPTLKGDGSPFSKMCTEMSRAEGRAGLFLRRAGCLPLGKSQGTAGLTRVTDLFMVIADCL